MALTGIATLSTLATNFFFGGSRLTDPVGGLVAHLNTVVAKVNSIISSGLDMSYLALGTVTTYYLAGDAWALFDGVNPLTVSAIRFQSSDTGNFFDATLVDDPGAPKLDFTAVP